jgi:hypothetical protein
MKSLGLQSTRAACSAASGSLDARTCDMMDDSHMIDSSHHTSLSSRSFEIGSESEPSLDDFKQDTFSTFINTRFRNADVGAFSVYTFLHLGYLRLCGWTRRHFRRFFFFLPTYFSSTDYFQVYLFVEFLGGTIRFEFLDKRDFWTTPAVERYQEQFVGAAAESNHRRGPTGRWPSSFWRVRYTWCCGARGKLQRLYRVGDGRSRRDGWM